ncbi:hypothetical protein GCU67_04555 [Modestobacter muralis]|uniref:Uncharacterized protein n=1 Tax=Modestobacter muralis TaxID=1608614 RepID=A0A6P0H4N3_9ACTN|nr:hypothetical protein [Modestobacter muralis]NEK93448.1 hypothetical protein [Modestobacter muralis]NEN50215.1 hypothetical protein [Modestobacter muralis]
MSATPSSSRPAAPVPGKPGMPASVKVSVGVLALLGVLLLLNALFTALAFDTVVDLFADARPGSPRSEAVQAVQVTLVQGVVFGGLGALAAWGLARRRGWARLTGLAVGIGLGVVTLVGAVVAGLAPTSLLVLVLCVAAVTSLFAPTTAAWAPRGPRSRV